MRSGTPPCPPRADISCILFDTAPPPAARVLTTAPATLTPRHRSARVLTTAPVLSPHWVAERAMSTPPPLTVPHTPYPCLRPTPHLVSVAGPRVSLLGARPTRVADGVQFGSRTVAFKPASVEAKREKALCGGTPSPPLGQALAPPSRPALLPKSRWSPKGRTKEKVW